MSGSSVEGPIGYVLSNKHGIAGPDRSGTSFVSSLLAIAGGQVGCVAVAAVTELCFARLLGPAPRGLISLCLMSIAFGSLIGSLGSEATIVVWISAAKGHVSTWFPAVMVWVAIGCLLSSALWSELFWRWHPLFLRGLTPRLARLVLATIPATVLFSVVMALLVGEERFRLRSLIALVNRVSGLVFFLISLALLGRNADSAIVGNLVGLVVATCIALLFLRHYIRNAWKLSAARRSLLPTIIFGIRGQSGNLASFFSYRLDVFIVNYFLDASQVGLYALGVLVSEVLWQLPGIVSTALCPRTARTLDAGAENFTCMIVRQVFLVTVIASLAVAVASPFAVPLIFGARFAPSVRVIWWILPGTVALSLGKVIGADLTARGLNIHMPISAFIGLVITFVLDWVLIPRLGIQGAALASSVAYLVSGAYLCVVIHRALNLSWRSLLLPSWNELQAYKRLWSLFQARVCPQLHWRRQA
jgi:stage V sporulation protein B